MVHPEDLGHPLGRRDAHVVFVVEPQQAQQRVELPLVELGIVFTQGGLHGPPDLLGDGHLRRAGDLRVGFAVEIEALHLEFLVKARNRAVRMGELRIGNLASPQRVQGCVERTEPVELGDDQAVLPLGQDQVLLQAQLLETDGEVRDRPRLVLHGDGEVGGHLVREPLQVFSRAAKARADSP